MQFISAMSSFTYVTLNSCISKLTLQIKKTYIEAITSLVYFEIWENGELILVDRWLATKFPVCEVLEKWVPR